MSNRCLDKIIASYGATRTLHSNFVGGPLWDIAHEYVKLDIKAGDRDYDTSHDQTKNKVLALFGDDPRTITPDAFRVDRSSNTPHNRNDWTKDHWPTIHCWKIQDHVSLKQLAPYSIVADIHNCTPNVWITLHLVTTSGFEYATLANDDLQRLSCADHEEAMNYLRYLISEQCSPQTKLHIHDPLAREEVANQRPVGRPPIRPNKPFTGAERQARLRERKNKNTITTKNKSERAILRAVYALGLFQPGEEP